MRLLPFYVSRHLIWLRLWSNGPGFVLLHDRNTRPFSERMGITKSYGLRPLPWRIQRLKGVR